MSDQISGTVARAIASGSSLKDAFHSVVQDIEADIIKNLIKGALSQMLSSVFGGMFGGFFGSIFGSAAGSAVGKHAGGGNMGSGDVSWVGERGPELFVPSTSGLILPNSSSMAMAGGKGGGSVFHIDARGADQGAIARLESYIKAINASVEPRSVQANLAYARRTTSSYQAAT
jgi:phage-related minor tail protein